MFQRLAFMLAITALTGWTSGCGLKGDLYLPDEPEQPTVSVTDEEEVDGNADTSDQGQKALTEAETQRKIDEQK